MKRNSHLSDAELLLALAGELDGPRSGELSVHLQHCLDCQLRGNQLESAMGQVARVHHHCAELLLSRGELPAVRMPREPHATVTGPQLTSSSPRRPFASVALLIACAALFVVALRSLSGERASAGPLPNPRLTPGAIRFASAQYVCSMPTDDDQRVAPAQLANHVFREYRVDKPEPGKYEMDYLISPALGGAEDVRNLWPQPYGEGAWNSRVKDALEDHLRRLVCAGRADLATVQQEMAANWIAAYRKYFRTREPVAAHALFVKDRPWE